MTPPDTIRLYGTAPDSIVDGPGLRFAVFVQGCTHGCPGCHNPDSQPACGGDVRRIDDLAAEIAANKLAQGVTISGDLLITLNCRGRQITYLGDHCTSRTDYYKYPCNTLFHNHTFHNEISI